MLITDIHPSDITFGSSSDLFDCGRHPEDGHTLTGSWHYLIAEDRLGNRFRRTVGYSNWLVDTTDTGEPYAYRDNDPLELDNASDNLARSLNNNPHPKLNPAAWNEDRPAYGSEAYCNAHGF